MTEFTELLKTADWKSEKHVPVIEAPNKVKKGEFFDVTVTIGKEVAHPNTTAHHIGWIHVYFHPEGSKFPYDVGSAKFSAHGASADGPDSSGIYTHHKASLSLKTDSPGTIHAVSYCNIHGLWRNSMTIEVD
jgi:superoxide reductase